MTRDWKSMPMPVLRNPVDGTSRVMYFDIYRLVKAANKLYQLDEPRHAADVESVATRLLFKYEDYLTAKEKTDGNEDAVPPSPDHA